MTAPVAAPLRPGPARGPRGPLRVRWLGRVAYRDGIALQRALHRGGQGEHLLLLEHPSVYTLGLRGTPDSVLVPPERLDGDLVRADRGGDVTWHGPGQLVGYPVVSVPSGPGTTPAHVATVEQVVIDALADLGLAGATRHPGLPGVWVGDRKICAVGVRLTRGRSMHGFALNVDPDLSHFDAIVPCGIPDRGVTSLAAEGLGVPMRAVADAVAARAAERWGTAGVERQDVAWRVPAEDAAVVAGGPSAPGAPVRLLGRLAAAGVDASASVPLGERKPPWLRAPARMGEPFRALQHDLRERRLTTVCEEAGCPNIFECWGAGTATFMLNGDRCTRACGFCLVDTRRPEAPDAGEPERVAEAVEALALEHAVLTAVARDDLPDGGAAAFAATIDAVRRRCPGTAVEVLIPDCKGDPGALETIFAARPDVVNHNLETVARLQRAVRPSASYARSLAVLALAGAAGLTTKSGLILGMGEAEDEVLGALADLRAVGVGIVTLGQYLRPTAAHLPVARWWHPEEFDRLAERGKAMGFAHVQASPLTRSSYHARDAAAAAAAAAASAAPAAVPAAHPGA
ncbi:MAG TPA: lipoyl synthase [Acidimicrobiales bacterium]|nr:lipoyl synthase [Acidimicrobiales bacterium]